MFKRVLLAFAVGLLATGLLIGLSFAADSFGFPTIASALSWQNTLLQSYVPLGNHQQGGHMKKLFAVALLTLSFSSFATSPAPASADAWAGARPSVQVAVTHGSTPDTFTVNAVVSDLRSGAVLAKPVMVTRAGVPARAEIGGTGVKGMVSVTFAVTVDSSGQTASYSSEVRDNAEVIASQSGTLAVTR